jgi:hypothetical protein
MSGLVAQEAEKLDVAQEIARLELLLEERKAELRAAQEELRAFKERYARVVGRKYIELAHVERAIKKAESALFNLPEESADELPNFNDDKSGETSQVKNSLRKMFWKVAQLFHPDHAPDDKEAQRRHAVMSEATRAYQDGDVDKLAELLGDDDLKFFCATAGETKDGEFDPAEYILELKDELRTIEYGLKRLRQDPLRHVMLQTQAAQAQGRDELQETASRLERRLKKAQNRLAQLGGVLEDLEDGETAAEASA